jgi:hypothetical protein
MARQRHKQDGHPPSRPAGVEEVHVDVQRLQRTRALRAGLGVTLTTVLMAALAALPAPVAAAGSSPTTYQGATYTSAATESPTADKPQSKLWWHDGSWWALMLDSAGVVRPHELRQHVWHAAGDVVDERSTSTGDALWADGKLHVVSRAPSDGLRSVRMSYDSAGRYWSRDSGFPVQVAAGGAESMTVDRDSTGRLWTTYTQGSVVWVAHTTSSDATWTTPFRIPGADTAVGYDDISAVVAFAGRIGVMWSDQPSDRFSFAVHEDGAAGTTGWSLETPLSGTNMADDHINIKTLVADDSGRLHAAIKTSQGDNNEGTAAPSIAVLTRDGGAWSTAVAGTVGNSLTRPMVLLDEDADELYLFATSPESGGTVYYKKTPLADISFASGKGDPFLHWSGAKINNVSGSKHPVNATTGLVVLGSDRDSRTYYHGEMPLAGAPAPPPAPTSVALRGAEAASNSGTSSVTVPKPVQVAADDVLVASVDVRGNPTTTPPAGWTLVRFDAVSTTMRKSTYVKVAGAAEPSSYTFGFSKSQGASAIVSAYSGVSASDPVVAAAGQVGDGGTLLVAPSVHTPEPAHVVAAYGIARATDIAAPSDLAERAQATSSGKYVTTSSLADGPVGAGDTGPKPGVADAAAASISHTVVLRPLETTGSPSPSPSPTTTSSSSPSPSPSPSTSPSPSPSPTTSASPSPSPSPTGDSGGTAAVALRGVTTGTNASETTLSAPRPAGVVAGDVLLASVDVRGSPGITPPAGWTLVRHDTATTTMGKASFVKVAGASEPGTYTWTFSKAQSASTVVSAWSGVSASAPVEMSSGSVNASSTSITATSVSPSAGAHVAAFFGIARAATVTPPSGTHDLAQATASNRYAVTSAGAHVAWPGGGATGDLVATASGAAVSIGHLVVLRPAAL